MNKIQNNILSTIIGMFFVTIFIFSFWDETPIKREIKVETIEQIVNVKDVEKWVNSLQDSPLKSNLLTVLGAEYGGDSEELNKLMKAFIEIRLQELNRQKTI